ncbi:PEP/pyruvate-binding domain-containing protein [Streptomyces sp. NPDC002817]
MSLAREKDPVPLALALGAPSAAVEVMGGKGASLARLTGAGLPVPGGFCLTTEAYRRAVGGLDARIRAVVETVDPADPAALETAAKTAMAFFAELDIPEEVLSALHDHHAHLGGQDVAVAVRSSATAEDQPDLSFAGQHDTFLNVVGAAALVDAVRACWASLWTARAIGYRQLHGVTADEVAIAVVVQRLVPADVAGIAFTADPVTGARDRVVINAAWGLGEAVVGGRTSADTLVIDKVSGLVVGGKVADKAVMTVAVPDGTLERPVPADLRRRPALSPDQSAELARLAVRVEELYGSPMDLEWALHEGSFQLLQARPVTTLPDADGSQETWNDTLTGDYLWTRSNFGEAVPSVMTPATWSLFRTYFIGQAWMGVADIEGHRAAGNIAGRCYVNLSTLTSVSGSKVYRSLMNESFGPFPDDLPIPPLPLSRLQVLRSVMAKGPAFRRALGPYLKEFPQQVERTRETCEAVRSSIHAAGSAAELARLWRTEVDPLLRSACLLFAAGGRQGGVALATFPRWLRRHGVNAADTHTLCTTAEPDALASLGPLLGLERLRRGELTHAEYAARWGHRCPDEFELAAVRPIEDDQWIDRQVAGLDQAPTDVTALLAAQRAARDAAVARFAARHPRKAKSLRARIRKVAVGLRGREAGRSETNRAFWVARVFWLRAGEVTGHGDELLFLSADETLKVLNGDASPLARVPGRRAAFERYRALPAPPMLIRGRFDFEGWAADPGRRRDRYDGRAGLDGQGRPTSDLTGFPGSAGCVEGTARVLDSMEQGAQLRSGEILVTSVTNVGWTPLFPRAAAVVTDMGAPLSHAAIVARELGIPAVVGCGDATVRLRTGDRIRVDGGGGTVTVLGPSNTTQP